MARGLQVAEVVEEGHGGPSLEARVRVGAAWGVVNNLGMRFASIAVTVVVVRLVSPEEFGVFAAALTVSVVLSGFADWGVSAFLMRGGTDPDEVGPTVAFVAMVSGALLALATVLCAPLLATAFGAPQAVGPIRVMALCLLFGGVAATPTAMLGREFRQDRLFAATAIGFVPGTLILLVLAFEGHGALAFAWSRVVAAAFQAVAVLLMTPRRYSPRLDPRKLRTILGFGLPLAGANLVNYVLVNADYVLIGHQLGPMMLGLYVLAFNVASWSTAVLSAAINGVAMPAFSRVVDEPERLAQALSRATRGVCLVALPVAGLTLALAEPLTLTLYGDSWRSSIPVLEVLALYGGMFVVISLLSNLMVGAGHTSRALVIQLVWISTLLPGIALGTDLAGLRGAAWAHVVVIVVVVLPLYLWGVRPLVTGALRSLARAALPPLLATVAAATVAALVSDLPDPAPVRLLVGGLAGAAVYAIVAAPMLPAFVALPRLGPFGALVMRLAELPALRLTPRPVRTLEDL